MRRMMGILLALLLLAGRAGAECPRIDEGDYPVVDGSTATLPLSYALMMAATGVTEARARDVIQHNRTTGSFYRLADGEADLLLVYEPSREAWEQGVELLSEPIGYDAVVFLVNEDNPVQSLAPDEIVGIYTGRIVNWAQVGGEDLEIVAYQRPESSGSQVMMKNQVMGEAGMMEPPRELVSTEMEGLVDDIASYRNTANAIGYSVYYYVDNMYTRRGVKLLQVDGVPPANGTIATGEYPYRQPFYAVIRADTPGDSPARRLFDWLKTDEGQALVEAAGYVPVTGNGPE